MRGIQEDLDRATADRRVLEHPFYKAWAAGTLTREDLSFYSTQYWCQVEAFPGYLEALSDRLPEGTARASVEANLADERDDDHPGLWLRFAEALGASRDAVRSSVAEPETASCVSSFQDAVHGRSIPFVMGMLYGYESQTPEVAETKIAGLREHYGVDGPAIEYFELHGELDKHHAAEMAQAIDSLATDESSREEAQAGARAGAEAIWGLLDGVARARSIT